MSNAPSANIEAATLESPYLTADEAAKYLRFPSTHWFRVQTKRYGIQCIRRGRRVFYTRNQLDKFMTLLEQSPGKGAAS